MTLVLDTSGYACCERQDAAGLQLLESAEDIYMPIPVLAELFSGFRKGSRFRKNVALLDEVVKRLDIQWIEADRRVAELYAEVFDGLRRKGRLIPVNDLWISACCLCVNGLLLTADRHFSAVDGLNVHLLKT